MDPDVTWGNGSGCPLVVHYWADLQSVHGFRCYDNIVLNSKCQRVLVLAMCLVYYSLQWRNLKIDITAMFSEDRHRMNGTA